MSNEMTPELLAHLTPEQREAWDRCQKATKAPWYAYDRGIGYEVVNADQNPINDGHRETFTRDDARFVAFARNYYPAALLELAQTKAELREESRRADVLRESLDGAEECITDRDKKLAALRAAVAEMPHAFLCASEFGPEPRGECDCPKSRMK